MCPMFIWIRRREGGREGEREAKTEAEREGQRELTREQHKLGLWVCVCACVCVIAGGMGGCCVTARLGTQNKTLFFCLQSRRAECQQQDSVAGHQIPARHGGTQ